MGQNKAKSLTGIALVVMASFIFAASDVATKIIITQVPAFEIIWFRYLAYSMISLPLLMRPPAVSLLSSRNKPLQILRGLGAFGSGAFFVASLKFIPITDATAISFTAPLFVAVLSAVFLAEAISPSYWVATLCGFAGALLIVKPGSADFNIGSTLPLVGSLCWATALVLLRQMSGTEPVRLTAAYSALIGLTSASLIVPFVWIDPDPAVWPYLAGIGLATTTAHMMTVLAYGYAPSALLAPFSYTQLIGATCMGYAVFHDIPTLPTVLGILLITASGLYLALRNRQTH
ncbi:MAG: DMT family transporter [Hyphomicrobiales bacterium]|nr:DMT family transporter [Hyphomicrobiales bacterium]